MSPGLATAPNTATRSLDWGTTIKSPACTLMRSGWPGLKSTGTLAPFLRVSVTLPCAAPGANPPARAMASSSEPPRGTL